jgi:hypothetical protein
MLVRGSLFWVLSLAFVPHSLADGNSCKAKMEELQRKNADRLGFDYNELDVEDIDSNSRYGSIKRSIKVNTAREQLYETPKEFEKQYGKKCQKKYGSGRNARSYRNHLNQPIYHDDFLTMSTSKYERSSFSGAHMYAQPPQRNRVSGPIYKLEISGCAYDGTDRSRLEYLLQEFPNNGGCRIISISKYPRPEASVASASVNYENCGPMLSNTLDENNKSYYVLKMKRDNFISRYTEFSDGYDCYHQRNGLKRDSKTCKEKIAEMKSFLSNSNKFCKQIQQDKNLFDGLNNRAYDEIYDSNSDDGDGENGESAPGVS